MHVLTFRESIRKEEHLTVIMNKEFSISKNIGIEITKSDSTRTSGFALINLPAGKVYAERSTNFCYVLILIEGELMFTCKTCSNKLIKKETMVFVPKDSILAIKALAPSEFIFFAFSTTIIRNDKELLNYYCSEAPKNDYSFNSLPVRESMAKVVDLISFQLRSKKIRNKSISEVWNALFFHTIQSYYTKQQVVNFLRPIFNSVSDFESFIENNYISSRGNVSRLIELSGMPPTRFYKLFVEHYGTTAKIWLDNKMRNKILEMAATPAISVGEIALEFGLITPRFCTLCRRLFKLTPKELIAQVQKGENVSL